MRIGSGLHRIFVGIVILTFIYWYREYFSSHYSSEIVDLHEDGHELNRNKNRSSYKSIDSNLCYCPLLINEVQDKIISFADQVQSSCSDQSTKYGKNQKVVSFSLFLADASQKVSPFDGQYFQGILINAENILKFYPGWVMRIYTYPHPYWNKILCNIACKLPYVFICNVENLPILGNVTNRIDAAVWRFLPLGDETVDTFVSRDLDSTFSSREEAAVTQWLESDKGFHAMRDHPFHSNLMLAGTWGTKNTNVDLPKLNRLRDVLLNYGAKNHTFFTKGYDQELLATFIYPEIKNDLLVHDSYFCERHIDSAIAPFPVRRINATDYIGRRIFAPSTIQLVQEPCPLPCRPPQGKDWIFC